MSMVPIRTATAGSPVVAAPICTEVSCSSAMVILAATRHTRRRTVLLFFSPI
jgi:hypothetical protein